MKNKKEDEGSDVTGWIVAAIVVICFIGVLILSTINVNMIKDNPFDGFKPYCKEYYKTTIESIEYTYEVKMDTCIKYDDCKIENKNVTLYETMDSMVANYKKFGGILIQTYDLIDRNVVDREVDTEECKEWGLMYSQEDKK